MFESCVCGHPRNQHADRENPLQVVQLHITEADEDAAPRLSSVVRAIGECTATGCGCKRFNPAEDPRT